MNYRKNKSLLTQALRAGYKTAAQFAQLLKARQLIQGARHE